MSLGSAIIATQDLSKILLYAFIGILAIIVLVALSLSGWLVPLIVFAAITIVGLMFSKNQEQMALPIIIVAAAFAMFSFVVSKFLSALRTGGGITLAAINQAPVSWQPSDAQMASMVAISLFLGIAVIAVVSSYQARRVRSMKH